MLGQVPALDRSRIPPLPSWRVTAEETGVGLPDVASNHGNMVGDMSGMEIAMGAKANALPTADQFAQRRTSLADEQKIV